MALPSTPGTARQLVKPEYRNWLSLGHALTTVLCQGLRPFITREVETFYRNVTARVAGPCTCVHVPRRRPNEYHDMSTCAWANILENYHYRNKPTWKQSDPTKWTDPVLGPWEIAKLFLPDLGGHADIKSADDVDITGILNLMYWCNHFTIPLALINDVRDTRNDKWVHVAKLELTDANKAVAFDSIENLLKDRQLAADPEVQNALREIVNLKNVSALHIFEPQVVAELIKVLNKEILNLTQQSETSQRELDQLKQLVLLLEKRLEDLEQKKGLSSLFQAMLKGLGSVLSNLVRNLIGIKKEILVLWLMMALCCSLFVNLDDDTFIRDGCPSEDLSVPFDTKEFGWLDYLNSAKEEFIGRSWLYRELESVFDHPVHESDPTGVLIIGNPGTGKSALAAQLVCSRTSSRTIHDRILGYHLCKHSDKNTQIAGKFVRNLAEMIGRRIPEYGFLVLNSSYILRSLNTDCVTIQDPVGCFEQAVLSPLKSLMNVPMENWYIVIDALDECLAQKETSHSIVYLLNNKLPRFPSWLKLVMTSRNESSVSLNSDSIARLNIDPEDSRNIEDIERFLTEKFYRDGPLLYGIKAWFGDSSLENTEKLISALLSKSQGNFLFVKEMIRHWETSRITTSDPYALPETLEDVYHNYFQRLYDRQEQFKPIRRVLEILVATFQPLTQQEIFEALRMKEVNLEQDYEFKNRMKELGHFLRYGVNNTVTLYHLSLTEWLTSGNNRNGPFYVSKIKGHEVLCDFYFKEISEGGTPALSRYSLTLVQHIAYGGWKKAYVKEFLSFPSQVVNSSDPESNRTLLHLAATINNTDVLELLLRHFDYVDSTDINGITPAFLAAEHGLLDNLALMVKKGANVNLKTKSDLQSDRHHCPDVVLESRSKFRGATMLHTAAHEGHLRVVNFLVDNGASISTVNDVNRTALQIAAKNGHVEVVKALYKSGAVADQTALHHAATNNRLDVVKYLLEIGVRDNCMRCDDSFLWLMSKHRLQRKAKFITHPCINILSDIQQEENSPQNGKVSFGELFDDKHLIFCETALHAAISSRHNEVVKELISRDTRALACQDYSGRTPLHESVRRNNKEIVNLLLKEDQTKMHSTCNPFQGVHPQRFSFTHLIMDQNELMEYHQDICLCGYTPLHLAAMYGNWEIAIILLKHRAMVEAKDCLGATPLHVAACYNHPNMVYVLFKFGADINSKTFNGSTPLHSAAACGAFEATNQLLYHGAIIDAADNTDLTPLHYTILNVHSSKLREFLFDINTQLLIDRRGHLAMFYDDENNHVKNTNFYRWLDVFINLILRGSNINAVDIQGRTVLHIAAENGLADAVNVLLQRKSQLEVRDKSGQTPLVVAVKNAPVLPKQWVLTTRDSLDELQPYLRDHEMVVYLLLSSGASLKKCNHSGESLLNHAIIKNQLFIAQLLLLKGASVKCKDNLGRTPLLTFLRGGGNWVDLILKRFNASVNIKCGKPFNISEFHLICYYPPSVDDDNFFQYISCDDHKCSSEKGPIFKAIENHPLKYKVIDSCLDAEGFSPLQRAIQGANIVAVRNLIKLGANQSLLSPHGYDALTLALLHAGNTSWQFFDENEKGKAYQASVVGLELLHHKMKTSGFQIICDSSKVELTLYHLAASRGLVHFIEEIFKEKNLHQLDFDCPNRDGITPMYLAKIFNNFDQSGVFNYNPWDEVVQFIENQGSQMQYPIRDAEYNVIYNRLFGWIPKNINFDVRPDVRDFVVELLSTYDHGHTSSMSCNSIIITQMDISVLFFKGDIAIELERQLFLLKRQGFRSRIPEGVCANELRRLNFWLRTYMYVCTYISNDVYSSELNMCLFYLTRKWHQEAFGLLPCYKRAFYKYRPYFVDDRKLKLLIKQFEDTISLWYVHQICFQVTQALRSSSLDYNDYSVVSRILYKNYQGFIRERMGWTDKRSWIGGYLQYWPAEFQVKFTLGLYRQYDYLQILNIGLEPGTRISLNSGNLK